MFPAAAHMSLAIEALRQVHEDWKLPFDGVTLREIEIKTALVIPESDDGIEIQLRLQQLTAPSDDVGWYTFSVDSVLDDHWTSHCEGKIAANLSVVRTGQDYKSPVNITKLNQRVPGRRWYDAFSRVGFDYTQSFQQLKSVRTNHNYNEAAADIGVLDTSGLIQGESRYILHPATVDACLQLIIISINSGLHKQMLWGVVPITIDEVNFWFPAGDLGSIGHAVAWVDNFEPRHFNTHTKLMGNSGNLIMDIKNLRCVSYEAAAPPKLAEDRPQEPYTESLWKPDISTLTTSKLIDLWHALSDVQVFRYVVEWLHHKYRLESLLLVGRPDEGSLDELLQGVPTATSIKIAYTAAEHMEAHRGADEAHDRISVVLLPENTDDWSDVLTSLHDLIIISTHMASLVAQINIVRTLKSSAKPRGWLLTSSQGASCDGLYKELSLSGWSVTGIPVANEKTLLLCDSISPTNGVDHSTHEVTMLSVDSNTNFLNGLVGAMTKLGASVALKPAKDFDPLTDKKVVIPDLSGTLLSDMSKDIYTAIQAVLCAPVSILWLTRGVKEGRPTTGSMVEGFLRVIRSEQAAARIVLLDSDMGEETENVGQAVLGRLDDVAPKDSGADTEFWLHDGVLHVARVAANHSLNFKKSALPSVPETQLLASDVPLAGDVQRGRLHFRPDSRAPTTLADNQVEVQVEASNLQRSADATSLVFGKVLRVGSKVGSFFVGKDVIAYAPQAFSTLIRTAVWEPASTEFDPMNLLATVPSLCQAVNAGIRTAKAQQGERMLLLPGPKSFVRAFIRLSQIFKWELSVVATDQRESQVYQQELGMSAEAILFAHDQKAVSDFVQGDASPKTVIAHDFSRLSKEVWRLIAPMGRFVLNDAFIDSPPNALPFAKGASFLTASVTTLNKKDVKTARELLKLTLSIFLAHQQRLTATPTPYDVSDVEFAKIKDVDEAVVVYNYGESPVQVRLVHKISV